MATEPSAPKRVAFPNDDVLASEAATYAFCAKAWHLEHVLIRPPSAETFRRRSEGTARHDEHGASIRGRRRTDRRLVVCSVLLLTLAGVLVLLAMLTSR